MVCPGPFRGHLMRPVSSCSSDPTATGDGCLRSGHVRSSLCKRPRHAALSWRRTKERRIDPPAIIGEWSSRRLLAVDRAHSHVPQGLHAPQLPSLRPQAGRAPRRPVPVEDHHHRGAWWRQADGREHGQIGMIAMAGRDGMRPRPAYVPGHQDSNGGSVTAATCLDEL